MNLRNILLDIKLHLNISPSKAQHIFVIGAPRSGTTLVRGIVSAHSKITTTDEETYYFCRRRTSQFVCREAPDVGKYIFSAKSKVEAFDQIANHFKRRDGAELFLEKTPEHAVVLDNLLRWYPKSFFVFVLRDGRDAYSSSFRNPGFHSRSGGNYPWLWRDIVQNYLRHKESDHLLPVFYENLVKEPEKTFQKVMPALGLEFEEQQLNPNIFSKTSLSKHAGHEKLNGRIDTSSIGAFRDRLSDEEIHQFNRIAGKELRALGYTS